MWHLPLNGQGEREPDGSGVEHGGYDLVHGVPRVARLDRRQRLVVVAQRVHVEQPRGREQQREHVGQGHGHEHHVGGRAHVPLGQHDHDQRVGHDGDQQQERHDVPVHGPGVLDRHLGGNVQVAADVRLVVAVRRAVEVEQARQVRGHHGRVVFLVHRPRHRPSLYYIIIARCCRYPVCFRCLLGRRTTSAGVIYISIPISLLYYDRTSAVAAAVVVIAAVMRVLRQLHRLLPARVVAVWRVVCR